MKPALSDDSSDDDEEAGKLRQAIAPNFKIEPSSSNGLEDATLEPEIFQPSNRTDLKDVAEKWNSGHFESVSISTDAQKFIAKKLSAALDKQIREKTKEIKEKDKMDEPLIELGLEPSGIYLFSNSSVKITTSDFDNTTSNKSGRKRRHKFNKLKKRKMKLIDDVESDDELTKLKLAAVSSDWVSDSNKLR